MKIWATELTVDAADEHKKAAALENLLTMFFSHPAVEGVILWHFWDGSNWHQNEALFNGPGITVALMQPIAVENVEIVKLKTLYILCLSL